jgi:predicted ATPase
MITSIRYVNFMAFKDATLKLSPLTVLLGPNSSGKTSALRAISCMSMQNVNAAALSRDLAALGYAPSSAAEGPMLEIRMENDPVSTILLFSSHPKPVAPADQARRQKLSSARLFSLSVDEIRKPVPLNKTLSLESSGLGLPAVLTTLQDEFPERFEDLNRDLHSWLPEFDRVLLDTPTQGQRALQLRTTLGRLKVPAAKLSAGTVLALALLTISHLPEPPIIVGIEEPDQGLHPRLMRLLRDVLLRLTMPSSFGDERQPVQVLITTHSPYLVDLFSDQLESLVMLKKEGLHSTFVHLNEMPNVEEIVDGASLGDAWFSGILGGVPA